MAEKLMTALLPLIKISGAEFSSAYITRAERKGGWTFFFCLCFTNYGVNGLRGSPYFEGELATVRNVRET